MATKYDGMGFVTLDELNNLRTTKLRELEERVLPQCATVERRGDGAYILDFVEGIFLQLQGRAKANLQDYVARSPAVKAAERAELAAESAERTKQTWEERVRKGRQAARDVGAL